MSKDSTSIATVAVDRIINDLEDRRGLRQEWIRMTAAAIDKVPHG
jgi:hypothetical protein